VTLESPREAEPNGDLHPLRSIAFYLPQFHPIPENDQRWGPGFTEWTNVTRATAQFRGHHQPHVPADLGFYDLRVPEVRAAQADLAREHGVSGFCYYHYWFEGRRLLQRPFDEVLESGAPDFPFCLCWANENWTSAWDGKAREVHIRQTYSPEDDVAHIRWLGKAFSDRRYIRVDGKPLLLVYRAHHLPEPRRTAECWRAEADRLGLGEIYLCSVHTGPRARIDPAILGFDAAVQFAPFYNLVRRRGRSLVTRAAHKYLGVTTLSTRHRVYEYSQVVRDHLAVPAPSYRFYPCVTPGFDNSPRRPDHGATIIRGSTPELYEGWLREVIQRFQPSGEENLLFVNAWNEWAEGNHLEPCRRWGKRYLEAHARLLVPHLDERTVSKPHAAS
jgi:lipopolysaccharide biosynthesis protein